SRLCKSACEEWGRDAFAEAGWGHSLFLLCSISISLECDSENKCGPDCHTNVTVNILTDCSRVRQFRCMTKLHKLGGKLLGLTLAMGLGATASAQKTLRMGV